MLVRAKPTVHDQLFSESGHPALTAGKLYPVVGISADHLRIINDVGEPILYEPQIFDIIDDTLPADWVCTAVTDEDGVCYYRNPPGLDAPGFYEDYFDGVDYAVARFEQYRAQQQLPPLRLDRLNALVHSLRSGCKTTG